MIFTHFIFQPFFSEQICIFSIWLDVRVLSLILCNDLSPKFHLDLIKKNIMKIPYWCYEFDSTSAFFGIFYFSVMCLLLHTLQPNWIFIPFMELIRVEQKIELQFSLHSFQHWKTFKLRSCISSRFHGAFPDIHANNLCVNRFKNNVLSKTKVHLSWNGNFH